MGRALALLLPPLALACHGGQPVGHDAARADAYEPVDATLAVNGLAFTPTSLTLAWPDTEAVDLTAHYTDDATRDVTIYASYTADPSVAIVTNGQVQPMGPGTTTITASYMGYTATLDLAVTAPTLAIASPDGIDFVVASARGTAVPLHSIRGSATTLISACGLVVIGSELFVADSAANAIDVWPVSASGNVAPSRRITTSFSPLSLAATATELFVGASDGVRVYDPTANGAATPTRTVSGNETTITGGAGIAVYQSELYVVNQIGTGAVVVFPSTADGNLPPSRTIAGTATGLASPTGIAVGFGLEVVLDATAAGAVQVFTPTSSGNVLPLRAISGQLTQLVVPTSAAFADTMLFVGMPSVSSIGVYPTSLDTEAPPSETIDGLDVQAMVVF